MRRGAPPCARDATDGRRAGAPADRAAVEGENVGQSRASAPAKNVKESDAFENLTHSCRRVHHPQGATCRNGHVVGADQFAETCRIDRGRPRQVQDNRSLAAIEKCSDPAFHFSAQRCPKSAQNMDDGEATLRRVDRLSMRLGRWIEKGRLVGAA
jgi:hypothetical protein